MTGITGRGRRAKELFLSGYNCAQSVAGAYADVIGLPEALVLRLSQPFGGGMGRMREVCGTLSGALFVVAQLYGGEDPTTDEEKRGGKARVYAVVQDIASAFRAERGTIICRELLGIREAETDPLHPSERTSEYYRKRPCGDICAETASILERYIASHPPVRHPAEGADLKTELL